jgi:hypothetical protein
MMVLVRALSRMCRVWRSLCGLAGVVALATFMFGATTYAVADSGVDVDEYGISVSPAHFVTGATTKFEVTITNNASNADALNDATIHVPAAFGIKSITLKAGVAGSLSIGSNNTISLHRLLDGPGQPLPIFVTVSTPSRCGQASYSWGSSADEAATGDEAQEILTRSTPVPVTVGTVTCTRDYAVDVSPGSIAAGHPTRFTVDVINRSSRGIPLGLANLLLPSGFGSVSASLPTGVRGRASVVGDLVRLRGLHLASGRTLPVTVTATPPEQCGRASGSWGSVAFAGALKMKLLSGQSALGTAVTTSCSLLVVTQPTEAIVGQQITGTALDPSGTPVTVEVVDPAGHVLSNENVAVTITLATNPGGASLVGTQTVDTVGGVARFTSLSLSKAGSGYSFAISSPLAGHVTTSSFNEDPGGVVCEQDIVCAGSVTTSTTSFQVTANPDLNEQNSGVLETSLDSGTALTCAGYTPFDTNWYGFDMTNINRSKTIVYTITGKFVGRGNDLPKLCFGAPYDFTTSSGTQAPAGPLPDGTTGFTGLLPSCPTSGPPTGPCVNQPIVYSNPSGKARQSQGPWWWWSPRQAIFYTLATITIQVPQGLPGDPWGRA